MVTHRRHRRAAPAGEVESLLALGHADAAEDFFDVLGVDTRVALEELVDDEGAGVVGAKLGQRALEGAADRGADGVHDHCFRHLGWFSLSGFRPARRLGRFM
jgi:hypothetical protein